MLSPVFHPYSSIRPQVSLSWLCIPLPGLLSSCPPLPCALSLPSKNWHMALVQDLPILQGAGRRSHSPFSCNHMGSWTLRQAWTRSALGQDVQIVHLGHREEQQSLTLNWYYSLYHVKKPQMLTNSLSSIAVSSEPQYTISNWKNIALYNYKTVWSSCMSLWISLETNSIKATADI